MAGTGSPQHGFDGLQLTSEEFERRLHRHGHDPEEIRRLWSELVEHAPDAEAASRRLGLGAVIAVYLGLLLVVVAAVSLLSIYWQGLGAWGILVLGIVFFAASLTASELLRRRRLVQPANVLEAVAVGWTALVAYAVERLAGVWPVGASHMNHVHVGLTIVAVVALAAGLTLLVSRPDPLLLVPLGLACGVLAARAAELVWGNRLSPGQHVAFVIPLGLAVLAIGLWLDASANRQFATWAHWVGLAAVGLSVLVVVPKTVPGFAVVGVLGAVALFFSALVRHWSFTVVGALGVLMATVSAVSKLGGLAPAVIAVVGIALVVVGLRWSSWRDTIRSTLLSHLPGTARSFVARLGS